MNYKKESQFTNNASKRVFEEVYTNEDMPDNTVSNGTYRLAVPQMFASNPSQEKAISPRRVMCEPKSHAFDLQVVYCKIEDDTIIGKSQKQYYDFTSQNTMEEILTTIVSDSECVVEGKTYRLEYEYDKTKGDLTVIGGVDRGDDGEEEDPNILIPEALDPVKFSFVCSGIKEYEHLWNLFNQTQSPVIMSNLELMIPTFGFSLTNVWSREPLYVHASFSTARKHYLCRTGDFWFKPSKYYYDNTNQNDFELFFTTDGNNRIIPYDAVKVIELCFILRQFARL